MTRTRYIAQAGVIAAVYAALTIVVVQSFSLLAWGPIQFRISEAMTVLAVITPAAVPGLAIGSVVANAVGAASTGVFGLLDVVFGSLGTLAGAAWSWHFRRSTAFALLGPVVANALIVPAYLPILLQGAGIGLGQYRFLGVDASHAYLAMYAFGVVTVGIGEAVVVYGLGLPLLAALRRLALPWLTGPAAEDRGSHDD
ncbi:MAG TPA: QueT transporter family protein [Coriobacteriia bacterium]